uniref:Protein-tyrosine-phosphatase n=1 Tax=Syphacia muris TaxID=451379 RepID=A0A158R543_9BILA
MPAWIILCVYLQYILAIKYAVATAPSSAAVATTVLSGIHNIDAQVNDDGTKIIITWEYHGKASDGIKYFARYRIANGQDNHSSWKYTTTSSNSVEISIEKLDDKNEIVFQLKAHRNGKEVEKWTLPLSWTVRKEPIDDNPPPIAEDSQLLPPPVHFNVVAMSPVAIRSLSNSIKIGGLKPREQYEITIRAATNPDKTSSTAAVKEFRMPSNEEFFRINEIRINSIFRTKTDGTVTLSWNVPDDKKGNIKSYVIWCKESGEHNWKTTRLNSRSSSVSFTDLKSDTEYQLKVYASLKHSVTIDCGEFKFKTSKVADVSSPIKDVRVVMLVNDEKVQINWTLKSNPIKNDVAIYNVYVHNDNSAPMTRWTKYQSKITSIMLPLGDFNPSSTYYLKIIPQAINGTEIPNPSIYHFQTMTSFVPKNPEARKMFADYWKASKTTIIQNYKYLNIGIGRVTISWRYTGQKPSGITIFYKRRNSTDNWIKVPIEDPDQQSVILPNLKPDTTYNIRIVPDICDVNTCNFADTKTYEFLTVSIKFFFLEKLFDGSEAGMKAQRPKSLDKIWQSSKTTRMPVAAQQQQQKALQSTGNIDQNMCLTVCNPDSIPTSCGEDERCVISVEDPYFGWCVPTRLRNAILNTPL